MLKLPFKSMELALAYIEASRAAGDEKPMEIAPDPKHKGRWMVVIEDRPDVSSGEAEQSD